MKYCPICNGEGCDDMLCEEGIVAQPGDWIVDLELDHRDPETRQDRFIFNSFERAYQAEQEMVRQDGVLGSVLMSWDELYGDDD